METQSDALLAGFDTYPNATLDVILGRFAPVGKLPVTLPRGEEVLAVNAEGVCISPNDVPGYDKDLYMPDEMKDENGKAYAYRDSMGNYYELNFGLSYPGETVKDKINKRIDICSKQSILEIKWLTRQEKEQVKYESKPKEKFEKRYGGLIVVYSDSSDRIVELFINSGCAWTGSGNCISVSFRRCNCICDQCSDEFF